MTLSVRNLHKSFGAIAVTRDVSLDVPIPGLHALIGPNGAGKTSLIQLLMGLLKPDSGRVLLDDRDITRLRPHARARLGLARTFQISQLVPSFTAAENVALAVQARQRHPLRPFGRAGQRRVLPYLDTAGLATQALTPAQDLSHGERRALELASALALEPRCILLDEPLAGMGHDEAQDTIALLLRLKTRFGLLLVEHDTEAVFALADQVSVLVAGAIIASGTPSQIRADPAVRAAYLGDAC